MKKQIEFIKEYCKFEPYSCYVILAVARKKDNKDITGSQEVCFKEVIYKENHIVRKYTRIYNNCKNYVNDKNEHLNFYIYISVNPRDTKKCYWEFQKEMLSVGEELSRNVDKESQLARLDKRWLSVLMNPQNKKGRGLFLLDIDTKDESVIAKIQRELIDNKYCTNRLAFIETKNGFHAVYEPFNRKIFYHWLVDNNLTNVVEVKIDHLLFLDRVEVKE